MRFCNECKRPADYTVCVVVSTNRVSPRFQKCTPSIALCAGCISVISQRSKSVFLDTARAYIAEALTRLAERVASLGVR